MPPSKNINELFPSGFSTTIPYSYFKFYVCMSCVDLIKFFEFINKIYI